MTQLQRFSSRLLRDETAATMIEYALMLALIAIVCVAAVGLVGTGTDALFSNASDQIATVVP